MPEEFDFVVIGGGSAGCTVAARLSEMSDCTVLLIEAGPGDKSFFIRMPLAYRMLRKSNLYDWGLSTEAELYADNRSIPAARGKVLGGSSSVNGMMYSRGHPRDYDRWVQLGATGWSHDEVLPFFKKSEANWRGESPWHGGDGPMSVTKLDDQTPLTQALWDTARELGYPVSEDFEGGLHDGFGLPDLTTRNGRRESASSAFLAPARSRKNLTVITSAHVTRLETHAGRVTQVHYVKNGRPQSVNVAQEVVLCGGSYASPHLLMLSGIGPVEHLQEHGITPVIDLPGVGQNLQEHPLVGTTFRTKKELGVNRHLRADRLTGSVLSWMLTGKGFAASFPLSAIIYHRSSPDLERPDLESVVMPTSIDARVWFPGILSPKEEMLTVLNVVLHPDSRGEVTLKSSDPLASPAIRFNILQAQTDVDRMKFNIRWYRELVKTSPLSDFVEDEAFPGSGIQSDQDLEKFIRSTVTTAQHPVGTCRMGPADAQSVVDTKLKVYGLENLLVADASVMPELIGGHTNAPSIMIGERAAQFIQDKYVSRSRA
ncbi:MAG: GMC family oxidoreductase N-terminal domain-containing protein [Emcibacter sp.]|nr:GMC family oxidoreductase N-terminal domain-containing protein [Emcibacter sp.]